VKELLRFLTDPSAGVYVTLWSESSVNVANEVAEKLMTAIGGPAAHTPPLGMEHMFLREGNKRKEKRLEYFNRDPRTVLLIDVDPLSEALNPASTVLVQPMAPRAEEGSSGSGSGSSGGSGGSGEADATCAAIRALIARIRADMQATGVVHVPRTLTALRADAAHAGFSTDATGM
jgi:hypothetical protein